MDQLLDLGLAHFPTLNEARKVIERYVPSKLALAHSAILGIFIGAGDCGFFTAFLLLIWILAVAAFSGASTMLKQWPQLDNGQAVPLAEFLQQVRQGDDASRFLAVRGATSACAFFGFAYLMGQPFVALGLYFPTLAIVLFMAATGLATRLGYLDRLREAADADNAAAEAAIAATKKTE